MKPTPEQVLATPMDDNDAGASTIREYLGVLLLTVWEETESFSGKRPFGNSMWFCELYDALYKAGFIEGETDPGGWISWVDDLAGDDLIGAAIKHMCGLK